MRHTQEHTIHVIASEDNSYDVTIEYLPGQLLRSASHDSEAEYGEDHILSITHEDGTELDSKEISSLGITDYDFRNLRTVDLTKAK